MAQAQGDLLGVGEHPAQLAQGPGRHQHVLALGQEGGARQVAHGQAVGVGGHQAQAGGLGGHEHAGEDGAGVVLAGGPHDLAEGGGEGGGVEGDRVARGLGQAEELLGRQDPHGELAAAGGDLRLAPFEGEGDRARLQGPHDVGAQAGGDDADPVGDAVDGGLHLDGEVEVGPGQVEHVALHLEADTRQRGQGATPRGCGPGRGGQGVEEGVTFGSELHRDSLSTQLYFLSLEISKEEGAVGGVDCGEAAISAGGAARGLPQLSPCSHRGETVDRPAVGDAGVHPRRPPFMHRSSDGS